MPGRRPGVRAQCPGLLIEAVLYIDAIETAGAIMTKQKLFAIKYKSVPCQCVTHPVAKVSYDFFTRKLITSRLS